MKIYRLNKISRGFIDTNLRDSGGLRIQMTTCLNVLDSLPPFESLIGPVKRVKSLHLPSVVPRKDSNVLAFGGRRGSKGRGETVSGHRPRRDRRIKIKFCLRVRRLVNIFCSRRVGGTLKEVQK